MAAAVVSVALATVAGCATTRGGSPAATGAVFEYTPAEMRAVVDACKTAPTTECRNDMVYVVKAHIEAEHLNVPEDRSLPEKAFDLLVLGGSTATTRVSGGTAKTNVSTGLVVLAGIRQIFDVGQEESGLHSSDVWERIVARMNLPLGRYPLQAALADLEEYRIVGAKE